MKRRTFLGAAGAACVAPRAQAADRHPNILFLLTDDQRADAVGYAGNRTVRTPALDTLAETGTVFENAFVTTSICVSSRASILTGRYMRTHGIRDFVTPVDAEWMRDTYPQRMREAGYYTGMIGKFGIGAIHQAQMEEAGRSFDYFKPFLEQGEYFPEGPGGPHVTDLLTGQALECIRLSRAAGRPFCLSISYKAPHGPWHEFDPEYAMLYRGERMPVPPTFTQEAFDGLPVSVRRSRAAKDSAMTAREFRWGARMDREHHHRIVRQYYRLITGVDESLARLRRELERLGIADNTIIVFTSDNGHFIHDYGLYGKWFIYEPSIRVPLVVYDPRTPVDLRGRRRGEIALNIDLAPTLLALAGIEVPDTMQGRSLTPLLRGADCGWRKDFFYEATYGQYAGDIPKTIGVRDLRWTYGRLISEPAKPELLFDRRRDPHQLHNLAGDPAHHETLERLRARCEEYRHALPDVNPDYDEYPELEVVDLHRGEQHHKPVDFHGVRSLGQTFRAETGRMHAAEFRVPTWGRLGAPCDLIVELHQHGRRLASQRFSGAEMYNQYRVRAVFDTPVAAGETLYLRVRAEPGPPSAHLAWWAYNRDTFPGGAAYVDDRPQTYDMELRVVFRRLSSTWGHPREYRTRIP
ncbi:sulfatase [Kiritimatiella glycovorans]|uniref:Arylsulfatase n=1 Tax=Kiritimatiella glycovorans TaxID=1307763 RepID=A0A0G3EGX1_9BACT|nr:sulfatase [Kiritimatiella glycovorans]AKJ65603.1 Arylsulfatase [Kiritimatiella glycovorans]